MNPWVLLSGSVVLSLSAVMFEMPFSVGDSCILAIMAIASYYKL